MIVFELWKSKNPEVIDILLNRFDDTDNRFHAISALCRSKLIAKLDGPTKAKLKRLYNY
jgi:hypothetical protein